MQWGISSGIMVPIVENNHLVVVDQTLGHLEADEPGSAGQQNPYISYYASYLCQ